MWCLDFIQINTRITKSDFSTEIRQNYFLVQHFLFQLTKTGSVDCVKQVPLLLKQDKEDDREALSERRVIPLLVRVVITTQCLNECQLKLQLNCFKPGRLLALAPAATVLITVFLCAPCRRITCISVACSTARRTT